MNRLKKGKSYFATCVLLLAMAGSNANSQVRYTSNFYGPGYYRIFNGKSGKNLDVVSNKGDITMTAINMAENTHALHSDAGSIVSVEFLDEESLNKGIPYGLYNIGSQGAGTKVITESMMEMFNTILNTKLGSGYPLKFIPVNLNPARTQGEQETVNDAEFGPLYQAGFNMAGLTALFRDNHGKSQTLIGDNFGFSMDATYASDEFKELARQYFPAYDEYCNWYLAPVDATDNYYTPPYNNAGGDGYINDGSYNWATVYVDFPFVVPHDAVVYLVDEGGHKVKKDWTVVPDNLPVLISWPGDGTNDVKLIPGMLTPDQLLPLVTEFQEKIKPWRDYSFGDIYSLVTHADTYSTAEGAFTYDAINEMRAFCINMMSQLGIDDNTRSYLINLPYDQFFAAIGQMVDNVLTNDGGESELAVVAAMVKQLLVNGIRNVFFYNTYNSVFGNTMTQVKLQLNQCREDAADNALQWCGDFFAYSDKSAMADQAKEFGEFCRLSGIGQDGEPLFENPVTEWNGNMAYFDPIYRSLQWIVNDGEVGQTYNVVDKLKLMLVFSPDDGEYVLYLKDDNNYKEKDVMPQGLMDYMKLAFFNEYNQGLDSNYERYARTGDYDQSNWVRAKVSDTKLLNQTLLSMAETYTCGPDKFVSNGVFYYINHAKVQLTNAEDKTEMTILDMTLEEVTGDKGYAVMRESFNTYIPAHFFSEGNLQKGFFFNRPKINEIAIFTWGVYDGEHMLMPKYAYNPNTGSYYNSYGLKGGYAIDNTMVDLADSGEMGFQIGQAYEFFGVVGKKPSSGSSKKVASIEGDSEGISDEYVVYPIYTENSYGTWVVTSLDEVKHVVKSTTQYVNLAGQCSTRPWSGVNIVVTRYTDGTTATQKAIF